MRNAFAIALLVLGAGCEVRFEYGGEPRMTHHAVTRVSEPRTRFLPANGMTMTSTAQSITREGDVRRLKLTLENMKPHPVRYVHVYDFFDHRGKLVRRHTFGPMNVEAATERTFYEEFRLEPDEKRYISNESHSLQPVNP